MIAESEQKFVQDAAARLAEHFDSVRIFVTRHDGMTGNTDCFTTGAGNFYAQLGSITEWRGQQDQYAREEAKKDGGGE